MFVNDAWYVCAMSDEVGRTPLGRVVLKQPLVLFRKEDRTPVILEDRCAHRRLPLSLGRLIGDTLQCAYHGLRFDCDGACVHIPGQRSIPPSARVKSYPAVERYGWLYAWMGDPERADPGAIPDFPRRVDDPDWRSLRGLLPIKCNYKLILDNLLDLSHVAYVHSTSAGNEAVAEDATTETSVEGNRVRVQRIMADVPAARSYAAFGNYAKRINRWQIAEYVPPGYHFQNSGSEPAGNGPPTRERLEEQGSFGFQLYFAITPETESTSLQFWIVAHPNAAVPEPQRESFSAMCAQVLREDHEIYEAQQRALEAMAAEGRCGVVSPGVAIQADRALTQGRRILDGLVARQ